MQYSPPTLISRNTDNYQRDKNLRKKYLILSSFEVVLSFSLGKKVAYKYAKENPRSGGFQKLSEEVLRRDDRISPTVP